MNEELKNFSKEEIFRLYDQNELLELINENEPSRQTTKVLKNRFSFFTILLGAGVLAGAASFFTVTKKNKLF